jgi:hypothetical protein
MASAFAGVVGDVGFVKLNRASIKVTIERRPHRLGVRIDHVVWLLLVSLCRRSDAILNTKNDMYLEQQDYWIIFHS